MDQRTQEQTVWPGAGPGRFDTDVAEWQSAEWGLRLHLDGSHRM